MCGKSLLGEVKCHSFFDWGGGSYSEYFVSVIFQAVMIGKSVCRCTFKEGVSCFGGWYHFRSSRDQQVQKLSGIVFQERTIYIFIFYVTWILCNYPTGVKWWFVWLCHYMVLYITVPWLLLYSEWSHDEDDDDGGKDDDDNTDDCCDDDNNDGNHGNDDYNDVVSFKMTVNGNVDYCNDDDGSDDGDSTDDVRISWWLLWYLWWY